MHSQIIKRARKRFSEAAVAIGYKLANAVIRTKSEAMWIGPILLPDGRWSLMPIGYDLYNGAAGIALFLGYLGTETQNERFTELARAAICGAKKQLLKSHEHHGNDVPSAHLNLPGGGFTGGASIIYAMLHLGTLWKDSILLDEALTAAKNLRTFINKDRQLDIIGGLAGCILVLISLSRQTGVQDPLDLAAKCGELLLIRSDVIKNKRVWRTAFLNGGKPLSGFSHGNAGFAYSLLELAAITSDKKFQTAAYEALNYEKTLFSAAAGNWKDLRNTTLIDLKKGRDKFATAWCNGAPGIALARLLSLQYYKNLHKCKEARTEIEIALATTVAKGFGGNHSLCHGGFGNIEPLLIASRVFQRPTLKGTVMELSARMLSDATQTHWRCGTPNHVETPCFMTGLAGIGFGLLRASSPSRIPSILGLECPAKYY